VVLARVEARVVDLVVSTTPCVFSKMMCITGVIELDPMLKSAIFIGDPATDELVIRPKLLNLVNAELVVERIREDVLSHIMAPATPGVVKVIANPALPLPL
jgi:hypothetical protein